jgi:hypothetical protein
MRLDSPNYAVLIRGSLTALAEPDPQWLEGGAAAVVIEASSLNANYN